MANIDLLLESIQLEQRIEGMAIAVTDRKKILYARGFGAESAERPGVSVTPRSLFRIASITKLVTGIVLLRFVEEGKLDLDAPVEDVLPWAALSGTGAGETVTLRRLMSHTAGLPAEYTPDGPLEENALEETLRRELQNITPAPEKHDFLYSNIGIRLAARMAEIVSGIPYTRLAQTMVLEPLGMDRTFFDLHVAATYPICLPHTEEGGVYHVIHRLQENAARYAAGGLFSNAEDLCRLARFFLNDGVTDRGERLLSAPSLQEMRTIHGSSQLGYDYGLTMRLEPFRGGYLYGHNGSAPPYATGLVTDPITGLGVVVLMNTQRDEMRSEIPRRILEECFYADHAIAKKEIDHSERTD